MATTGAMMPSRWYLSHTCVFKCKLFPLPHERPKLTYFLIEHSSVLPLLVYGGPEAVHRLGPADGKYIREACIASHVSNCP